MTRRQVLYILAGAALLAAAGALMLLRTPDTTDNVVLYPDAYSREYYLNLCGWQVTLLQEDTVTIPRQFNDTYRAYSQKGEFLMLASVSGGTMTTVKSFFEPDEQT